MEAEVTFLRQSLPPPSCCQMYYQMCWSGRTCYYCTTQTRNMFHILRGQVSAPKGLTI